VSADGVWYVAVPGDTSYRPLNVPRFWGALPNQFQSKLNLSWGCRCASDGSGGAGDLCTCWLKMWRWSDLVCWNLRDVQLIGYQTVLTARFMIL